MPALPHWRFPRTQEDTLPYSEKVRNAPISDKSSRKGRYGIEDYHSLTIPRKKFSLTYLDTITRRLYHVGGMRAGEALDYLPFGLYKGRKHARNDVQRSAHAG